MQVVALRNELDHAMASEQTYPVLHASEGLKNTKLSEHQRYITWNHHINITKATTCNSFNKKTNYSVLFMWSWNFEILA